MNRNLKLHFRETCPRSGKKYYCLDIEELSIEVCIKLLFRMFLEENGHLLREGSSWLSLKKSQ